MNFQVRKDAENSSILLNPALLWQRLLINIQTKPQANRFALFWIAIQVITAKGRGAQIYSKI
ncbi:hypothetical protein A2127_02490 [Candidatus Jorgensenbacteria bacterium GWC1_48_12]|uniref:Uncharacterized protein n=1 Tax=Candidatus Jorgensenbacteria bacterium GWC1_48_12 TaxID=1798469 RepID=A0A1F6BMT7_9BACT|nr:MAG: hypothetical protein A2127_02490 [Candidatus Jorgensenbacteria bacterium GWC1_48_12]